MEKIYKQVMVIDRLPSENKYYDTDRGRLEFFTEWKSWRFDYKPKWWLEEVQFPNIDHMKYSDPDPDKYREHSDIYDDGYADGANDGYIDGFKEAIDKIKGNTEP